MLTPELFARVIEACGEAARPVRGNLYLAIDSDVGKFFYTTGYLLYLTITRPVHPADAHNACVVHWLGMLAPGEPPLAYYFDDGKPNIERIALNVMDWCPNGDRDGR